MFLTGEWVEWQQPAHYQQQQQLQQQLMGLSHVAGWTYLGFVFVTAVTEILWQLFFMQTQALPGGPT